MTAAGGSRKPQDGGSHRHEQVFVSASPRIMRTAPSSPDPEGDNDLLEVIQMWIRLEGPALWWTYEMFPWQEVRQD